MPESLSIAEGLQALAAKAASGAVVNPHAGTEKILFVEDEAMILEYAKEVLEMLGYTVRTAMDAQSAIQVLVEGFEPHLLCSDIVMPGGMNGVEMARQVAELMPKMKVLLASGYGAGAIDGSVSQDGFHILSKPYTPYSLGERVRNLLDGKI